jgi:hypothetical protein
MSHRRIDRNPNGPERRHAYRREEDDEVHTIANEAGPALTFVKRTRNRFETLIVGVALGGAIGFPSAVLGARVVGPRQDIEATNRLVAAQGARITAVEKSRDSLLVVLGDIKREVSMATRLGCLNSSPGVAKAAGCP